LCAAIIPITSKGRIDNRTVSDICKPTAILRKRCEPLDAVPVFCLRASASLGRRNCSAGAALNASVTKRDNARVNPRIRESTEAEYGACVGSSLLVIIPIRVRAISGEKATPAIAPQAPSTPPSISSCRIILDRAAPSA